MEETMSPFLSPSALLSTTTPMAPQHFAGARSSQFATGERKIFGGGHADRAAGKADFAGNGHDGILLWLKTP
jgi:hypothetical protein